ncbi:DUF6881 domain-containing protein [Streptomyces sp. NBC_00576]|uniref:DUF6881 domain-containing protein n=1 Tax=Streptomyces sp. NBC_00576 TaxID=2903665 RepID=UPI002E80EB2D|nr:hypothetical protein [Streptomyces sp. NBC_00576]WUB71403.1 hypothetical protein OG734_15580 [Streptomyces sp. NBC_00576]
MEYWKVDWLHDFQFEATRIYNEIGDDGYEVRKVYQYRDGRNLKADEVHESDEIGLGTTPVGPIEDVVAQSEFEAVVIARQEFETEWQSASWPAGTHA